MVGLPTEFRASVDSYAGPLDLLLYLIKKDEVDIFDIPLSDVILQYQIYLEVLKEIDPNACGEFLVMAANLMEIKSKLLLPREELADDEEYEDPRIELVRQLLEYKKFKERALLLEDRLDEHKKRHHRPPADPPPDDEPAGPLPLGNVDVWDLLTAFHRIQIALGQRVPIQVVLEERPLEEFMDEVVATLRSAEGQTALFDDLFLGARTRQEAIGYFLAVLELAKQYRLVATQGGASDIIHVRLRADEEMARLQREEREDEPLRPPSPESEGLLGAQPETPPEPAAQHLLAVPDPDSASTPAGGDGGDAAAADEEDR